VDVFFPLKRACGSLSFGMEFYNPVPNTTTQFLSKGMKNSKIPLKNL
jgi:hypothetical protein